MALPTASNESKSGHRVSGSGSKPEAIDVMLQRLGFEEDEIDDFVLEDFDEAPIPGKWLALARVHTLNPFSIQTFE